MASVAPPRPSYRPHLSDDLVRDGLLSDAQLESVIYAGEAHSGHLSGAWTVAETWDVVSAAGDDNEAAVRFRRGWFLGDGSSDEHTSELQALMRSSYADSSLKQKKTHMS